MFPFIQCNIIFESKTRSARYVQAKMWKSDCSTIQRRCIKWDFVWISPSGVVRQSAIKKKRRHNINNSSVKNESRFRHNCSSALSLTGKIFRRPIDTWLYEQIENIHIHQTNDAKEKRKWKTERSILMYVAAVCDSDFFHNQEWILVISYFFPIFETKLFQLIRNFEIIFSRSIINRRVSHHWTNVAKQSELPRNASQIRASNNRITPAESSAITDAVPRKRQIRDTTTTRRRNKKEDSPWYCRSRLWLVHSAPQHWPGDVRTCIRCPSGSTCSSGTRGTPPAAASESPCRSAGCSRSPSPSYKRACSFLSLTFIRTLRIYSKFSGFVGRNCDASFILIFTLTLLFII